MEARKQEVRARLIEQSQSKKKKGFMTPERKKKLRVSCREASEWFVKTHKNWLIIHIYVYCDMAERVLKLGLQHDMNLTINHFNAQMKGWVKFGRFSRYFFKCLIKWTWPCLGIFKIRSFQYDYYSRFSYSWGRRPPRSWRRSRSASAPNAGGSSTKGVANPEASTDSEKVTPDNLSGHTCANVFTLNFADFMEVFGVNFTLLITMYWMP